MPAIVVFVAVIAIFALAYRYYSTYLAERVYALDPSFTTPAHEFEDGVDYVPTNRHVLFGHHFTSIAGAAPIVGPAIAVVWGWVPALFWIVAGTVLAAGVHDMGSLVVSVRNKATNIGTLAQTVINPRSRTLFLAIIFFLLTLVNAVFAIVIGTLFVSNPEAVIPITMEIPLAIGIGQYIHRTRTGALIPSILGVIGLYLLILVGIAFPIDLSGAAEAMGMSARTLWIVLLFVYGWIASRIPVWVLLQPRDYINSHQLFIALGVIFLGVIVGLNTITAPAFNDLPADSPNWFPFLFVTIACGAVSGFHSLVSSGTTAKQLDRDTDARFVGYMGSLGEGSLALGSVLATTAGIGIVGLNWNEQYPDFATASSGALSNFVNGVAGFASNLGIPESYGTAFAAVIVISFAATTLDTGIRLQRYIIQEVGEITDRRAVSHNINLSTTLAVLFPLALALAPSGEGGTLAFGRLWTLFGTTNQLTAGLALAVVAVWVTKNGRNALAQIVPLTFLLAMTTWALFINLRDFIANEDWLLAPIDLLIFGLAVWLIVEAILAIRGARSEQATRDVPAPPSPKT